MIDVDVALRGRNASVHCQRSQCPYTHTFAGQVGDESAPSNLLGWHGLGTTPAISVANTIQAIVFPRSVQSMETLIAGFGTL